MQCWLPPCELETVGVPGVHFQAPLTQLDGTSHREWWQLLKTNKYSQETTAKKSINPKKKIDLILEKFCTSK